MKKKPTYDELEHRVRELEKKIHDLEQAGKPAGRKRTPTGSGCQCKELEASLRLTQFCFDSAALAIYYIQSDGRILNVNIHAAGMLGYTVEELSGSFVWDIDPDAHPDTFDDGWRKLVAAGVALFEVSHIRKDGHRVPVEVTSKLLEYGGRQFLICFAQDITKRKQAENEREKLLKELRKALENVKALSGLLPICASCKKIRDDKGYWNQIEHYIHTHSEAEFSHGLCPDCVIELYPDCDIEDTKSTKEKQ
jgi:PAS domain S-box-containing protein